MKVTDKLLLLGLSLFLIISCRDKESATEYDSEIRYRYFNLEESGWKSLQYTQHADDINFIATEVPIPFYILKSEGNENLFHADSIEKTNKNERIFEFSFSQDDEKDLLEKNFTGLTYEEGIKYMSFSIEKDFYVVTSKKDTIQCAGATYERNFKVAPFQKIVLFFSGIPAQDKIQLVYQDRLFKKGTLKFKFEEKTTKILL